MGVIRKFINSQIWLSRKFDKLLPFEYSVDGNGDFIQKLVPKYLTNNLTIYDVGAGKNPFLSPAEKESINAYVVGLDIDNIELGRATVGSYDEEICADISEYQGKEDADLIICQALLEHVRDVESAFESMTSILKPGGLVLLFVPSRNAVFARLNLLLPQRIKKALLHTIFPHTKRDQGFPSFYNKCTPSDFMALAKKNNLRLVESRFFYISSYFSFFFPAYFIWRLWVLLFHFIAKEQAAETFSFVFCKSETDNQS